MELLNCWPRATSLISAGQAEHAVELCEGQICSASIECQRYLGWSYYRQGNMEKALLWFLMAENDAEALYGMGSIYVKQKSYGNAADCFEQAAKAGFPRAYYWLGNIYLHGLGVPKDVRLAQKYYEQGAEHGYILAERALLYLKVKQGNILTRCVVWPNYIFLLVKAGFIAYRDISDERIADIPNFFLKKGNKKLKS